MPRADDARAGDADTDAPAGGAHGAEPLATITVGEGRPLLLLHAALSSARDLRALAERLATAYRVTSVDRRGTAASPLPPGVRPGPIDVAEHVAELAALVERAGLAPVTVVGHSYGGCLALELAARQPTLVAGVWAYEPPYAPLGGPVTRARLEGIGQDTVAAYEAAGLGQAAEAFLAGVVGQDVVRALPPAARERIRAQGAAALADASLLGLEPGGLARIEVPVTVASGGASEPMYAEVAEALVGRIRGARHRRIPGVDHMAPVNRPATVAVAILEDMP